LTLIPPSSGRILRSFTPTAADDVVEGNKG
jgi:hypothetical protein